MKKKVNRDFTILRMALLSVLFTFFFVQVNAQNRIITGNVTAAQDAVSLPGVSVVKGTINGVLVFSSIGVQTQEIIVGSSGVIDVSMKIDSKNLDEVFVIAYGTAPKASCVSNNSGQPGSGTEVRIRGRGSFSASNFPLYVVDGVPTTINSSISSGDIESVTVLKDAAAASLYGSRAANGVILITTKQDRKGIAKNIDFSATGGSDKTQFYAPCNVFDQQGLALNSDFKRYSVRVNLTHKISGKTTVGIRIMNLWTRMNANSLMQQNLAYKI